MTCAFRAWLGYVGDFGLVGDGTAFMVEKLDGRQRNRPVVVLVIDTIKNGDIVLKIGLHQRLEDP